MKFLALLLAVALSQELVVYKNCQMITNRWDCYGAAGDEGALCMWNEPKEGKSSEESCVEGEGTVEETCMSYWSAETCQASGQCIYDDEDGKCTEDEGAEGSEPEEGAPAFDCSTLTSTTCNKIIGQGQQCGWDAANNACSAGYPTNLLFQCRKFGVQADCESRSADYFCSYDSATSACTTTYRNDNVATLEPEEIEAEGEAAEGGEAPEAEGGEAPEAEGEAPEGGEGYPAATGGNTGSWGYGSWGPLQFMDTNALNVWSSVSAGNFNGVQLSSIGNPMTYSTQVVQGQNYRFLFEDGRTVTVYQNLQGVNSVTDITNPTNTAGTSTSGTSTSSGTTTSGTSTSSSGTATSETTGTTSGTTSSGTEVNSGSTGTENVDIPTNLDQATQDAIAADEQEVEAEIEAGEEATEVAEDQQEVLDEITEAETAETAAEQAHETEIEAEVTELETEIQENQAEVQEEINAGESQSEIAEDEAEVQDEMAQEENLEHEETVEPGHLRSTHVTTTSTDEEFFKKGFYFLLGVVSTLLVGGAFQLWRSSRGKFGRESIELDQSHLLV